LQISKAKSRPLSKLLKLKLKVKAKKKLSNSSTHFC
jgi:hypothetical protein